MNTTQSVRLISGSLCRGARGGVTTGCLIVLSASVLFLFWEGPAWGALPAQIATAEAEARYQDFFDPGTPASDPVSAIASASTGPDNGDSTTAHAEAAVPAELGGPAVKAYSGFSGASPAPDPMDPTLNGRSQASVITHFIVEGGDGPVDVDLQLAIHGFLQAGNFFSGQPDVSARVELFVQTHLPDGTASQAFFGTAELTDRAGSPGDLTVVGGWALSDWVNVEGDETIDIARDVADVLTLFDGDVFAVEMTLLTEVHAAGPFEAFAQADFSNTVGLATGTSTPGATIRQLVVPEPAGLGMLGFAGLLVMLRARRTCQAA